MKTTENGDAVRLSILRGCLLNDIASGLWQVVQLTPTDFQEAQQLPAQYAPTRSLHALDYAVSRVPGLR
jgi:hypothetical protein